MQNETHLTSLVSPVVLKVKNAVHSGRELVQNKVVRPELWRRGPPGGCNINFLFLQQCKTSLGIKITSVWDRGCQEGGGAGFFSNVFPEAPWLYDTFLFRNSILLSF
jgi:hypothetical protein